MHNFSVFVIVVSQLELENYHLKNCNQRLTEQIEALQDTLQGKCIHLAL